ncbi:MAG: tRNA 2-thiouridine(34) synthase MnmA, partial [Hyphomicrobiales bacterium]|nr:tRNA 2-thiouridine(34) synthase MnmA [Hyphomicrobiales bacterium]
SRDDGAGGRILARAADPARDQSYFLFATTKPQLARLRFPLGDLPKADVRAVAREIGLAVADKADSQDICFVPAGDYAEVVEKLKPDAVRAGEIVHVDGRSLGRHAGVIHYTVGQRRGIGVATGEPLYVVRLDAANARVVVGPRDALGVRRLRLRDVNWLGEGTLDALPREGVEVAARVRSTRPPAPARLTPDGIVELADGETGVAPGQACALYAGAGPGARVLGGGFIEATADEAGRAAA